MQKRAREERKAKRAAEIADRKAERARKPVADAEIAQTRVEDTAARLAELRAMAERGKVGA